MLSFDETNHIYLFTSYNIHEGFTHYLPLEIYLIVSFLLLCLSSTKSRFYIQLVVALSAYCAHIENVKDVLVHVIIYASLQEKRGGEGTHS